MSQQATDPPRSGVARAVAAVDDAVFTVEKALVTIAALVMTTTVFLDIVYRSFASDESQLARKLTTVAGWFGAAGDEGTYEALRDYATPVILAALAFLGGWAVFVASRRRQDRPRPLPLGLLSGLACLAACYGFVEFVVRVDSRWVCTALLLAGSAGYLFDSVRRREPVGMVLAVVIGAAGSWVCRLLPPQYIWSQELSLILLAWVAFIGGSMATRLDKHISVDALSRAIPQQLRPWTRALCLLVTTVFSAYITVLAYEQVFGPKGDYNSGEVRPATQLPAWTIIFSVVVAFALMTVRFFARTVDAFVHPRVVVREPGH